jgi:hypothetical protein
MAAFTAAQVGSMTGYVSLCVLSFGVAAYAAGASVLPNLALAMRA